MTVLLTVVALTTHGHTPPALTDVQADWRERATVAYHDERQAFNDPQTASDDANALVNYIVTDGNIDQLTTRDYLTGKRAVELVGPVGTQLGPATHTEYGVLIIAFPAPTPINDGHVGGPLDCISFRESERGKRLGEGYGEAGGNGGGRYQFEWTTGQGLLDQLGRGDWTGHPAWEWPSDLQDTAAALLYSERGTQPWPPSEGKCG